MNLTTSQKNGIDSLVNSLHDGIVFLVEQMGEVDEQYEYGIRHVLSQQVSSGLSRIFGKDSTDCDTVGNFLGLYGVDDIVKEILPKDKLREMIMVYLDSEDFENL